MDSENVTAISSSQLLQWTERICWAMLVLWPVLRLLNGHAVSREQAIFRWAMLIVPALAVVVIRVFHYLGHRSNPG